MIVISFRDEQVITKSLLYDYKRQKDHQKDISLDSELSDNNNNNGINKTKNQNQNQNRNQNQDQDTKKINIYHQIKIIMIKTKIKMMKTTIMIKWTLFV